MTNFYTTSYIIKAIIAVYGINFRVRLRVPKEKAVDTKTHLIQELTEEQSDSSKSDILNSYAKCKDIINERMAGEQLQS